MKIPTAKTVGGTTDEVPTLEKKTLKKTRASWWYVVLIQGDDLDVLESL